MKHLLCKVPIFAGLDDEAIDVFLEHAKRMDVPAGGVIAPEGEISDRMYLIEAGEVTITKNSNTPNPVTLAVLGPGEFFGEMCILEAQQPRCATVRASKTATVLSVPSSAFHHLYEKMPKQNSILLLNIARDLSRRLRHLDEIFAARH